MGSLTRRGRWLLAIGATVVACGWWWGQAALVAAGTLLLLLPAIGVVVVRRMRIDLTTSRIVTPPRICVGEEADVQLTVLNGAARATGALLLEDTVSEGLTASARLLLDRVPRHGSRVDRYPVHAVMRGRATVGPLRVTAVDPFGTAAIAREFTETSTILVTPRIVPLTSRPTTMAPGGRGETMVRALAARGDDDILPREHRAGDDMRRVHWPATARHGDLMVRREEQAWHSTVVVILDNRAIAHHGTGAASTLEWAVSAAASIAVHHVRLGWRVSLVDASGDALATAHGLGTHDDDAILHACAQLRPTMGTLARRFDLDGAAAVVAVLGRVDDAVMASLAQPEAGIAGCLALDPAPAPALGALGWRVSTWTPSTPVDIAWAHLAGAAR